ncbi:divalent-cation tolerance protein CutA [Nocardiopsis dassonvillei]|uniref:divalent-cation tolerance protein CutA n=1 Tax=Nocardiopsis dassonvillei TaxID=2014 RepID=UPI00200BF910|nr:divalent-cation tolerance protein CutA [Nocardiopsis dassonvillei]MCK9871627.1 divalent-cation tolerance protein CutA [Nocardiopsis dassonvillei]
MPQSGDTVRVETTVDSRDGAERLARSVVEHRLAACAQVSGPITSFYRWEGRIQADEEWTVVVKTAADRLDELTAHLGEVHPYDVPEVVAVPVTGGNPAYLEWVRDETRRGTSA